jgi:NTE family protein
MKSLFINFIAILVVFTSVGATDIIYSRQQLPLDSLINGKNYSETSSRPRIGLVLSGGGARGIAHVGVLKAFEKHNIPIDLIVGTSIGSIIGGLYCAGYSADELEQIVKEIGWDNLYQDETEREDLFLGQKKENDRYLLNVRFDGYKPYIPSSFTPGQKLLSILSKKLLLAKYQATKNFDQLRIPFRSISTDLISGKRIVIKDGDLAEAISASSAVPLLFSPIESDGKLLIDGGVRANVPVDVAIELKMDIIVAVDITSPLRKKQDLKAPWEIADQVTTIMMGTERTKQLKLADIVVKPDLEGINSAEFEDIQQLISKGEESFNGILYDLYSLINQRNPIVKNTPFPFSNFDLITGEVNNSLFDSTKLHATSENIISMDMIKDDIDNLYSGGQFNSVCAEYEITEQDTSLVYRIKPNPSINQVIVEGNKVIADSIVYNFIENDSTGFGTFPLFISNLNRLKNYYWANGFSLMKIDSIVLDSLSHNLFVKIDEGIIDSIKISGNNNTEDIIILREFSLKKQEIFNAYNVYRGIENIYNTQYFDRVGVNVAEIDNENQLNIKVKEKKFVVLKLGGKIGNERGAQAYYDMAHENFLGQGYYLSLAGRIGDMDRLIGLNFRTDRIFKSYLTLSFHSYYSWQVNPYYVGRVKQGEYLEERRGGRLIIGQQLKKLGQLTLEFRVENAKNKVYSNDFDKLQNSELRTITIRSVADKRDKVGFTNDGIYNMWYWESGNEQILEGQESYTKAYLNLEGYYTTWPSHTLHIRFTGGFSDKTLPFSEYFRFGGLNSFMGLHNRELIGRQALITNLEYRYKLPVKLITDTYLGLRYDIGAIWEIPNLVIESKDFFYGSGVWLGFDTLVGPLLFGYGKKAGDNGLLYLSIGYEF